MGSDIPGGSVMTTARGLTVASIIRGGLAGLDILDSLRALGGAASVSVVFSDGAVTILRRLDGPIMIKTVPGALSSARAAAARFN